MLILFLQMGSVLGQLSDFDKNNVHSVLVDCSRSMPRNRSISFVFFVYCCNKTIVVLKYVYDFFSSRSMSCSTRCRIYDITSTSNCYIFTAVKFDNLRRKEYCIFPKHKLLVLIRTTARLKTSLFEKHTQKTMYMYTPANSR